MAWLRQPVLWLGFAIFVASLAGCVWMIVLASQGADAPVDGAQGSPRRVAVDAGRATQFARARAPASRTAGAR